MSYFLCQFSPRSRRRGIKEIVREILKPDYAPERIAEFVDLHLPAFQAVLVEEFNSRFLDGRPLRFKIADSKGVGSIVQGYRARPTARAIAFQNALNRLTAAEFERLASVILKIIGCEEVFSTPGSHDQGVDAFGYQSIVSGMPYGTTHNLTWVAQAKHYRSISVSTGDIRELIGSRDLLVARAFSTVDERYRELRLRAYAPIAVALITTEEMPTTVRRLAENAGVYVFAASDLFHILGPLLSTTTISAIRRFLQDEGKLIPTLS